VLAGVADCLEEQSVLCHGAVCELLGDFVRALIRRILWIIAVKSQRERAGERESKPT